MSVQFYNLFYLQDFTAFCLQLSNGIKKSTKLSQPHGNRSIDLFQHQNDQHIEDDACGCDCHPNAGLGLRIRVHGPHTQHADAVNCHPEHRWEGDEYLKTQKVYKKFKVYIKI